ncbi:probable bifunctional dTTP/UTP pyrophosphatase/methyltransferase protein [Gigantopelta aegis]|uniref:probable bifunctional dTTP/UTP pyrophosphatase/methyltransferase protein n=1 Tax=Gigantopelta aegis TaxID=1735272 RepID=UPI001B88CE49|nr:probable bifunctional dTTP/UTP pyrophosphatase/methyltransferase protein [Gigantopelta aegis]
MLQPIMHILNTKQIILASGSPRRKQILQNIGMKFDVVPSTFEENLNKSEFAHPSDYVIENARLKTLAVAEHFSKQQNILPDLIIGADTVVAMDNKIYEKPKDQSDAFSMLSQFSGRSHMVYTGIVLIMPASLTGGTLPDDKQFKVIKFFESTEVIMTKMSPEIINSYINTGEPMDKAGGYGIQGIGGTLVEAIKGDYFNVMGFPLHRFSRELSLLYSGHHKRTLSAIGCYPVFIVTLSAIAVLKLQFVFSGEYLQRGTVERFGIYNILKWLLVLKRKRWRGLE